MEKRVADEQSFRIVDWLAGLATLISSAAVGFVMRASDRLTLLEERIKEHDKRMDTRGPVLYDTQKRVAALESEMAHINVKLIEQAGRSDKIQTGIDEILSRIPRK